MNQETILILDFGSQYTQLIARKIRELNVYCEIHPWHFVNNSLFRKNHFSGIILSGSPFSVHQKNAPQIYFNGTEKNIPVLGICYGAQLLVHLAGGKVLPSKMREYGRACLSYVDSRSALLKNVSPASQVWMSHGDTIAEVPPHFEIIARTDDVPCAGYQVKGKKIFGIQFHPEVYHTTEGMMMLRNFVVDICGCSQSWTPASFIAVTVNELKQKLDNGKTVLALSGGVDSTVTAALLHKAIGKKLCCIFVDNGLLRKNEFREVLESYKKMGLRVQGVDAKKIFYRKLKAIKSPERKRKIIGKTFIDVFNREAGKIKKVKWLAQGTIYPDVIESVSVKGPSATIKSHHNVGGLPKKMKLQVVEPLKALFKDEVRKIGKELGIDENILMRHPFPGPGLGIRILGEVTEEKVRILQEVDHIFIEGLKTENLYNRVWQAGAILTSMKSVGVMGDERTYEHVVALRAVSSTDGMTADWCRLPYEFLSKISNEIINKVKGVNRVVYDISSKPPATIEWE